MNENGEDNTNAVGDNNSNNAVGAGLETSGESPGGRDNTAATAATAAATTMELSFASGSFDEGSRSLLTLNNLSLQQQPPSQQNHGAQPHPTFPYHHQHPGTPYHYYPHHQYHHHPGGGFPPPPPHHAMSMSMHGSSGSHQDAVRAAAGDVPCGQRPKSDSSLSTHQTSNPHPHPGRSASSGDASHHPPYDPVAHNGYPGPSAGGYSPYYPPPPPPPPPPSQHHAPSVVPSVGGGGTSSYLVMLLQQREDELSKLRLKVESLQLELQEEKLKSARLEYQLSTIRQEHDQTLQIERLKLAAETASKQQAYQNLQLVAEKFRANVKAKTLQQAALESSGKDKKNDVGDKDIGNDNDDETVDSRKLSAPPPPVASPVEQQPGGGKSLLSPSDVAGANADLACPPKRISSHQITEAMSGIDNGVSSSKNEVRPLQRILSDPKVGTNSPHGNLKDPPPNSLVNPADSKKQDANDKNDENKKDAGKSIDEGDGNKEISFGGPKVTHDAEKEANQAPPVTPNYFKGIPLPTQNVATRWREHGSSQVPGPRYVTSINVQQARPGLLPQASQISALTWEDDEGTIMSDSVESRIPISRNMGRKLHGGGATGLPVPLASPTEPTRSVPSRDLVQKHTQKQQQQKREIVLQPFASTKLGAPPATIPEDSSLKASGNGHGGNGGHNDNTNNGSSSSSSEDKDSWNLVENEQHHNKPTETKQSTPPSPPKNNARATTPLPPSRPAASVIASDWSNVGGDEPSTVTSCWAEDRVKVVNKVVADPYGDRGLYTGTILLSTGLPHGAGRMLYSQPGRTYDGEWRHGRWNGFGRATFSNGDSFEGTYVADQRNGKGVYKWNDGRVYDGEFQSDKRHGKGTFIWPDGALYDGDFVNGQRDGHGIYQFADGGRYEGGWDNGRYNGVGTCTWADGRCYHGEWKAGLAHGQGIETFADGSVRHDGQWSHDEPIMR